MLVLWYLNPDWTEHDAMDIAMYIVDKHNGFTTFTINRWNVARLIDDLSVMDLDEPPRNKLRKIVFKPNCGLTKSEKLSIVGKLIGRLNGIKKEDIYNSMLLLNDSDEKITIAKLAKSLNCTPRTIHRHMCNELKQEKANLNNEI
jgi:hypothetical protein